MKIRFPERAMTDFSISEEEYRRLVQLHKRTPDRRRADRIRTVLLPADGRTVEDVTQALLLDDVTVSTNGDMPKTDFYDPGYVNAIDTDEATWYGLDYESNHGGTVCRDYTFIPCAKRECIVSQSGRIGQPCGFHDTPAR